jgi:hypothetical protein
MTSLAWFCCTSQLGTARVFGSVQCSSDCRDTLEKKESGVQGYHGIEEEHPLEFEKRNINVVSYNLKAKQANASATHDIMETHQTEILSHAMHQRHTPMTCIISPVTSCSTALVASSTGYTLQSYIRSFMIPLITKRMLAPIS